MADFRSAMLIPSATDRDLVMSWITRRIAGSITFAVVSAILTAYATYRGWISGELTLTTAAGAGILGIAFLSSLVVTSRMKSNDQARQAWDAWEQNQRAWQQYYAQMYAAYGYVPRRR
jgi:hypothetical protein